MKYRHINTEFWSDEYIFELNDKELKTFIYLFTNEKANMVGIYKLSEPVTLFTLHLEKTEYEKIKNKFETDRKYFFYKGWVYVVNNHKHVFYSSAPNIIKAFCAEFNRIPKEVKNYFLNLKKLEFQTPISKKKEKITINEEMEMVMEREMEMEMESRLPPTLPPTLGKYTDVELNEDVDPNIIPDDL